ncbi:hypothetical protein B0181_04345 [Moraxella caviae]|uniref:Predicted methyltransferase (Contains TPR repeat) n=1 Tax=Moraxella caviae TaxID=34060 RepID=A0A1T0A4V8_9GAMM|nr:tetratricopeptide repeat protein [Moraxella caviae]OOR90832.1 hypothetical protein B0181_04345 [Moraxella caviae]STZ10664.1 Predicted methyltransferase (contains TPR repeat) [Moraxella caviae]
MILKPRHANRHLASQPHKSLPNRWQKLGALAAACVLAVLPVNAKAESVFDPLLRILLPFYQPSDKSTQDNSAQSDDSAQDDSFTHENEQTTPNAQHTNDIHADEGDDAWFQHADDGSDDAYLPADGIEADTPKKGVIRHNEAQAKRVASGEFGVEDLPDELFDELIVAFDTTPMIDSPDLEALLYAEFAADRGNPEQALTIYKAESFKQNATPVFERALGLSIEYEEPAVSLAFATAWQMRNPEHIPAWFYVTHLAIKAGDYDQAAKMLAMILQYDPHSDLSQIFTGILPNAPADQRALFVALQDVDGADNASVSVLRAGLLMRLSEYQAALLHINHALTLEPANLALINLKIDILQSLGDTDALWQFIHAKRSELPHEHSLYLYEIRTLINQGDLMGAWRLLQEALAHTQNADVMLLGGLVALDVGDYHAAIDLMKSLTQVPEFRSQAHYYLGIGYERLGDLAHARTHYEKVDDYEHVLDARTKVVGFYLLENRVDAAMATLVRLRDDYEMLAADSYILQAEIHLRQNDKEAAKDLLTVATRQYPDDDRLLYASFQLLENELTADEKRQAVAKLLELDGYNPRYQLMNARLILADNPNDAPALATAQNISLIGVDDPLYDSALQLESLVVLSEHALKQGDYQAVIDMLQMPYDVAPSVQTGVLLLRAYQGLGDDGMVAELLADLQARFGTAQSTPVQGQGF